ncbi:MAG: hydroxyisourate hydrolase [Minicystis sp.]
MSGITTHILDTSKGRPASGVGVVLELRTEGGYREIGRGETDSDGRLRTLVPAGAELQAGVYRISFATGAYYAANGVAGFYPEVTIAFEVKDPGQHYHVPLLLNPFGYSTYRGS